MQPQTKNINYEEYIRVSEFKYLFSLDSYDNDCEKKFERESRLPGSLKIMKSRYLSKHTKPKTYTTVIKPIVLFF